MKFPLIHTGRRFFFFTFVVEGRMPVLSRLVRGAKRPVLLPAGERIVEVWRDLHRIEPCFAASDFVVMPDHVHLLLIVNSVGEFRFNPRVFGHWFREVTSDGGRRPPNPLEAAGDFPAAPTGGWAAYYAGTAAGPPGVRGCPPSLVMAQPPAFAWSTSCWVDISFDSRQLSAIRRYIKMNPARYFWKLDNPDMFRFRPALRHPVLDPALSWSAIGDVTLLASPFLYPVRLSMKRTAEELESEIAEHVERARHGWTPVCGFLSPGEREFERRLKALPFSRWIKAVPYGLPERYDPSVEDSRWLAAHRELILSSFDRSQIEPFRITRPGCLAMNERIADMAARASTSDGGRRPPNPLAPASATGGSGVVATGGSGVSPVVRKEGSR